MNIRKTDTEVEKLLREEIRRAMNELFEAMDRMAAVEGAPMTQKEIQTEIDAVRTARRARGRCYQHCRLRAALDGSAARATHGKWWSVPETPEPPIKTGKEINPAR